MNTINPERCANTMELLNILMNKKYSEHIDNKKDLKKAFKDKIEFIIKDDKSSRKIEDLKKIIDHYVTKRNKDGWTKSGIIENGWIDGVPQIKILNEAMDELINEYKQHDDSGSETDSTISSFSNDSVDSIENLIEALDIKLSPHNIKGTSRRRKKSKRKRKTKSKSIKKRSNKKKSNKKRKTKRKSNKKKRNLKKKHK